MQGKAFGKELSENSKLGGMSTTYAAIGSCSASCPFMKSRACYGMNGPISWQWGKLSGQGSVAIAEAEAEEIDKMTGNNNLRIHTLGDCKTDEAAQIVSAAAERFMARGGRIAFAFTHSWRKVKRSSWGKVSILASCETPADVAEAKARGYATAIVVKEHAQETAHNRDGMKVIPCLQQTGRSESCQKCKLCLKSDKLAAAGVTIQFSVHGPSVRAAKMLEEKN